MNISGSTFKLRTIYQACKIPHGVSSVCLFWYKEHCISNLGTGNIAWVNVTKPDMCLRGKYEAKELLVR